MGLHINYELRLPAVTSREDATRLLQQLRHFASTTGVEDVSPLFDLATDLSGENVDSARRCIQHYASVLGNSPPDSDTPHYVGDSGTAMGFSVYPGKGSETATFGLIHRRADVGEHAEWFWWCGCKTQYASVVSDAHLVKVHTSLVTILDSAIALGFDVVVRDETGYWSSRSVDVLLKNVKEMNRVVARIAGAFSDALGDRADSVGGAIFEHPEFEHLEMELLDRDRSV